MIKSQTIEVLGMLSGFAFVLLSIYWSTDPANSSILIFLAGASIFIASLTQIENVETTEQTPSREEKNAE